jgi:hypothetical protein
LKRPSLGAIGIALVPYVAMCFTVAAWDRIYPMVFGLPFNFFWLLCWIVLTSACMLLVHRIEAPRRPKPDRCPNERVPK